MKKLREEEYQALVIVIPKAISPQIIKQKKDSIDATQTVAIYSKHIADEVINAIIKQDYDII